MSDIEQKCRVALQALSDWSVTYAPDMCDPETVEKAKARILEHGTLAYIANATDQLNAAIQLLSEAETREREARAKALDDLRLVAERVGRRDAYSDDVIKYAFQRGVVAAAKRFSSSVSALQSEER